ncbi:hypothetical protein [Devosia sp.]|uniref:hypothetical protein n=1 Tax=Devosia sp. TaxID=1871048 RepID=UPI003F71610A
MVPLKPRDPVFIGTICDSQLSKLERSTLRARRALQARRTPAELDLAVHADLHNIAHRASAVDPYEALRASIFLTVVLAEMGLTAAGALFLTLAPPRHRSPPGLLTDYSPDRALRYWFRGLAALRRMGFNPLGFCVFEVARCRPLNGPEFDEPHLHAVIWGVTAKQIKVAFAVRKLGEGAVRNRPLKVQAVYDLQGLVGYLTKFRPELKRQYRNSEGKLRWRRNHLPEIDAREWFDFVSRYAVADLLKFQGIDGRKLVKAGCAELSVPDVRDPADLPRKGRRGPK